MSAAREIEIMLNSLKNFFKTDTVIGQPLELGKLTLVPIISVTFGIGSSGNENLKGSNSMGLGGGVKISVDAMVAIKDDTPFLIPIKQSGNLEKFLDLIPEIIDKFKKNEPKKEGENKTD
ncbi:MAG TPA: sporulation protein [Clostridia bacterium]|nr:sporulation protein [Clostridia bacterium]